MMCGVRFRDDQKAAGILVDPVNDAWPLFTSNAGKIALEMMKQRVYQCSPRRAGSRVYDHPDRFVDDDQIGVFVDDRQRNFFCDGLNIDRIFDYDFVNFTLCNSSLGI